MDILINVVFVIFILWLIFRKRGQKGPKQQMVQQGTTSSLTNNQTEAQRQRNTEWEAKKDKYNHFVTLFNDKQWQNIIDEFDGYDFEQYSSTFDDYQVVATAFFHLGNDEKTAHYIELAASNASYKKSQAYLNAAIMYLRAGKYDRSMEWLLKSEPSQLRADKKWDIFYKSMRVGAECFMNLGLIDEGITFLKQAPTSARILDADLADVFEWLGQFYEKKGIYDKALKSYQKVVTVRYDKELNKKILDLNQLVLEQDMLKEERAMKRKTKRDEWDIQ